MDISHRSRIEISEIIIDYDEEIHLKFLIFWNSFNLVDEVRLNLKKININLYTRHIHYNTNAFYLKEELKHIPINFQIYDVSTATFDIYIVTDSKEQFLSNLDIINLHNS